MEARDAISRPTAAPAAKLGACLLAILALLVCLPAAAQQKEPDFPALTGRVVDNANLLDSSQEWALAAKLEALEEETGDQLVVVTLPSLEGYPIETYGYLLGRHWGIGTAKLDNGLLLVVAPNERKVRIEVGYGLEGKLTDLLSHLILEDAILPRFRQGDFPGGIEAGVNDIALALTGREEELRQRALPPQHADDEADWILVLIWIAIVIYVIHALRHGGSSGRRSGWSGGSSGGRSSGGGFSGGGGSFGGGGSSGSW